MIKERKIKEMTFLSQITYYVYMNDEDRKNDKPFLITSDKEVFNKHKKQAIYSFIKNFFKNLKFKLL